MGTGGIGLYGYIFRLRLRLRWAAATAFARKPSRERHGCRHPAALFRRPCYGTTPLALMQQGC